MRPREHRDGARHLVDGDGEVDALHLLQQSQADKPAQLRVVLGELRILSELGEERRRFGREIERREAGLGEREQLLHLGARESKEPFGTDLVQQ